MEDDDEGEEELQADEAMRRSPEPVRVLPPPPPPPVVRRFAPVTKIANGPTESKALEPYQCYEFIFDPLPDHIVEQLRRHIEAGHNGEMEALELLSEAGSYEPIVDAEYFAQLKESLSATPRAVSPLTLSVQELIDFDAIVAMPED